MTPKARTAVRRFINFIGSLLEMRETKTVLSVAEALGKCTIFVGIIIWLWEIPDRKYQRNDAAWTLINSAHHQSGDAGRRRALEALMADDVRLDGIDLSQATLNGFNFKNQKLYRAKFIDADIAGAQFGCPWWKIIKMGYCSNLVSTKFDGAILTDVDFRNANLTYASFARGERNADVYFDGALLWEASFRDMTLTRPSFQKAHLYRAIFSNVTFEYDRVTNDFFDYARIGDVDFSKTNVTKKNLDKATVCNVTLSTGEVVNRDCAAFNRIVDQPKDVPTGTPTEEKDVPKPSSEK